MTCRSHQRLFVLLVVLVLAVCVLPSIAQPLTPDGLLSQLDKQDRVTLTTADGREQEISVAEMERLTKEQHRKQAEMQREATATAPAGGNGGTVEYKDDEETAPKLKTERLDAVRERDPRFAANIQLAQRSFRELARQGHAHGYTLTGFSEKDDANHVAQHERNAKAAAAGKRSDYRVTLLLRAKRDAQTDTSATVAYEVRVQLDARDQFAVLAAWELDASDKRSTRLTIAKAPSAAAASTTNTKALPTTTKWQSLLAQTKSSSSSTYLLAGGVACIVAGVAVLYVSQRPAPRSTSVRISSPTDWELAPSSKKKLQKKQTTPPAVKKTN